jgi:hypothetical protein
MVTHGDSALVAQHFQRRDFAMGSKGRKFGIPHYPIVPFLKEDGPRVEWRVRQRDPPLVESEGLWA